MSTSGRRSTNRTLATLAGITIVAIGAVIAVTQLRSSSPGAAPTSLPDSTMTTVGSPTTGATHPTTVPSVAIDPRGQPFSWTDALHVPGQTPVALLEHDGTVFLFTGTPSIEDPEHNASTGLRTWVSTDGTDWELRSVIEENYEVNTVISSRFGLLAAGFDPANGDGLVWQSADGNTWTQMLVSAAPVPRSGRIVSAVATDELVYIRSETQGRADHRGPAEQALTASGHVFEDFWFWYEGTSSWVIVLGPFGIHTATVPFADIGLTRAEVEPADLEHPTTAWVTTDGSNWSEHAQPAHMRSTFVGSDGTVLSQVPVSNTDNRLSTRALNPTDMTWHEVGPASPAEVRSQWPGGFLGRFPNDYGQVSVSTDGLSWRNLSPGTLLPGEVAWDFFALAGGERGIAMIGTALSTPQPADETVEWDQDGFTIVADQHAFEVFEDGVSVLRVLRGADDIEPDARWDPAAGTLELAHPSTGETVVNLDIDDVSQRLPEQPTVSEPIRDVIAQAFLFSHSEAWPNPGVISTERGIDVWTVQDFGVVAPERASHLLMTADRVVVATSAESGVSIFVSFSGL